MLKIQGNPRDGYMLFYNDEFIKMYEEARDADIALQACKRLLSIQKTS